MQQWSYPGLKIAPGRYSGSLYTDDLVIAGHNYARHFSPLTQLTVGTEVLFVDMNDNTWHYAVSDTEVLQPTQIEEMAVKTPENNWDLTLFTCTTTGQARYALRCCVSMRKIKRFPFCHRSFWLWWGLSAAYGCTGKRFAAARTSKKSGASGKSDSYGKWQAQCHQPARAG